MQRCSICGSVQNAPTQPMEKAQQNENKFCSNELNQIESNGVNVDNYFNLIRPKCAMIELNVCVSFQSMLYWFVMFLWSPAFKFSLI